MRVVFLRAAHGLAHDRVDEAALHFHHHRLGIGVADHHALKYAFRHRRLLMLSSLRASRAWPASPRPWASTWSWTSPSARPWPSSPWRASLPPLRERLRRFRPFAEAP